MKDVKYFCKGVEITQDAAEDYIMNYANYVSEEDGIAHFCETGQMAYEELEDFLEDVMSNSWDELIMTGTTFAVDYDGELVFLTQKEQPNYIY